ncbi:acetyltransferase [Paenibacillus sp. GP183]|uniref:acetyltransferase n=1 Tax=Paenibacillus sp. GP183 TaxID=1882751 RepID=UPI00089686CD|nr:acetyltransferase [Paenibacillus sp. GP183]SEC06631.1 acetyltransferase EpsM [Paenibacillus sp. GP183]
MEIAVIGDGGHCKVIREMIGANKSCQLRAILDDKYEELILEHDLYLGPISAAQSLLSLIDQLKFVVAIGNNAIRKTIVTKLGLGNEHYASLIHEKAIISSSAVVGQGTVIMANAVINADAQIGNHTIVNTGAIVEHDNRIGDYVHVAPHATLTGSIIVKEGAMIGAGATIIPGRYLGEWAIIGAGSTVIRDIQPNSTAVGTPAIIIKAAI